MLLVGTAGLGAATWRPEALSQPTYTGLLVNANSLIGSAEDIVARFDAYRASLEDLVANVGIALLRDLRAARTRRRPTTPSRCCTSPTCTSTPPASTWSSR